MEHERPAADGKRFGTYLRKIREERRLSLDAVEEMSLGLPDRVTKSHLSRIENGQAVPSFPRMFTLSQIYGVPVASLAERFELCLKARMVPPEATDRPIDEVLGEARRLRRSGRYAEALLYYESILLRAGELPAAGEPTSAAGTTGVTGGVSAEQVQHLRLECVNCLVKLQRPATAKEECEQLLASAELTPRNEVVTLHYFAMCCYKLGKLTVALMAVERATRVLERVEEPGDLDAHLAALEGNLLFIQRDFAGATEVYRRALRRFDELNDGFESCRIRLNIVSCLIEAGSVAEARVQLRRALETAESGGYDRQRAFALSHQAVIAFRERSLDAAEAYCLRSNRLARPREYVPILFRNCFYLWKIARARHDVAGIKTNERTLRTYLNRVDAHSPEAEEFREFLGGGDHA